MAHYFEAFINEALARRRRIASTIGPLAQGWFDLALLGGVVIGSVGLFAYPWMPWAAPWGFALPFACAIGHGLLDARRQTALARGDDSEKVQERGDFAAVLWGLGCASAGVVTFAYAYLQEPAPPPPAPTEEWAPPDSVIELDISR
jgi:hypothetical protein